jgi:hypothetical protein
MSYNDLTGTTIAGRGCALTSLNMALNNAGENWNPETLNSLLDAVGGYTSAGSVIWPAATAASNGGSAAKPVIFDDLGGFVNSDVNLSDAINTVETAICGNPSVPVIVGVRSPKTGFFELPHGPGHFVLITGEIVNPDGQQGVSDQRPWVFNDSHRNKCFDW